jgi:hypothetical protein
MPVLTPEDHTFFADNGYLVVPNSVPQENLEAMVAGVWRFLGMDPNNPEDWYRPPLTRGCMAEMYQTQEMWNNRQHPKLHQVFSEILGTEKLWVSFDRCNMKPPARPEHPEYDHKGFMHWDMDVSNPPFSFRGVQGVLYLTDTAANQGGFQCIPGAHKLLDEWMFARKPEERNRGLDMEAMGLTATPIVGKAGDLVIWDTRLPHGNGHNTSDRPRLAQYISMHRAPQPPLSEEQEARRQERIRQWREHAAPRNRTFPGDERWEEERNGATAELTPLGRKLLGLDFWE